MAYGRAAAERARFRSIRKTDRYPTRHTRTASTRKRGSSPRAAGRNHHARHQLERRARRRTGPSPVSRACNSRRSPAPCTRARAAWVSGQSRPRCSCRTSLDVAPPAPRLPCVRWRDRSDGTHLACVLPVNLRCGRCDGRKTWSSNAMLTRLDRRVGRLRSVTDSPRRWPQRPIGEAIALYRGRTKNRSWKVPEGRQPEPLHR